MPVRARWASYRSAQIWSKSFSQVRETLSCGQRKRVRPKAQNSGRVVSDTRSIQAYSIFRTCWKQLARSGLRLNRQPAHEPNVRCFGLSPQSETSARTPSGCHVELLRREVMEDDLER